MKINLKLLIPLLTAATLIMSCRGGVNKNNDHDYDGKNERDDRINPHPNSPGPYYQDTVNSSGQDTLSPNKR